MPPTGITARSPSAFTFFFSRRRRHTRSYGDWSSDVCSSDLRLQVIVKDALCSHLVMDHAGELYFTDDRDGKIYFVPPKGQKRVASAEVPGAGALTLTDRKSVV